MLDLADRSWPLLRRVMAGHTAIYQASGGRVGHRFGGLIPQTLLLEHVGAKSGTKRISPLTYTKGDGDDLVLVASKGGYPKNPAWFHNLKAHPDTVVQVGRERRTVRARVATDEEHKRLWPRVVETYSGYAAYQKRTDRKIPLVILERR
ncbi:MAG TPA: nitroreductase family deazaflavin-dependent oxidoreductase [Thermoleophilaceae bacterium]|nr:nitroreductase family deazaflavin-dependent oxidoreductase [Thermoleophilaceae bacterium]